MRLLDLFSGIGGFSLAAQWVWGDDLEIISFVEIDPFCQRVLRRHWPTTPIHDDICTFGKEKMNGLGGKIDICVGGPPCQHTSVASAIQGKRTGETLWPEMARVIRLAKPEWVVVEQPTGNKAWETQVERDLENLGYSFARFERQAIFCGAPHSRRRLFIIANPNSERLLQVARFRNSWPVKQKPWPPPPRGTWRSARTGNCGVDAGISNWVDRLKSLGNAVVPQVAYEIFRYIKIIEDAAPKVSEV